MKKFTDKEIVERVKERLRFHAGGYEDFTPRQYWNLYPVDVMQQAAKDIVDYFGDYVFED